MNRYLLIRLLLVVLVMGMVAPVPATAANPEEEANRAAYERFVQEVFNAGGDLSVIDEVLDENIVFHPSTPGGATNREAFKAAWQANHAALPDLHVTDYEIIAQENRVAAWQYVTWTFENEWAGLPPTGREVGFNGLVLARFNDGKIVELWDMMDSVNFMQQLGAIPTESPVGVQEPWDIEFSESDITPDEMDLLGLAHGMAMNNGDFETGFDAVFAPDMVGHIGMNPPMNLEEFKGYNARFWNATRALVGHQVSVGEGNLHICYYTVAGTYLNDLPGMPPASGQPLRWSGMIVYRVENGQVAEIWQITDSLSMFNQIMAAVPQ